MGSGFLICDDWECDGAAVSILHSFAVTIFYCLSICIHFCCLEAELLCLQCLAFQSLGCTKSNLTRCGVGVGKFHTCYSGILGSCLGGMDDWGYG